VSSSNTSNAGSCRYNGRTYAEGQTVASASNTSWGGQFLCDNGSWILPTDTALAYAGASICDGSLEERSDLVLMCNGAQVSFLAVGAAVKPHHGPRPLTVTLRSPTR